MNLKSKNGVCGIIASIIIVLALSISAFAEDLKVQCIEKECIFHSKPASDSTGSRPPIPFHSGH